MIFFFPGGQVQFDFPTTQANTNASDQLDNPNSAELLKSGHILIADENDNRAIEVTRDDQIVATYTASGTSGSCCHGEDDQAENHLGEDKTIDG